jgi:uncharacterized protein YyaL (SSP411 family)
MTREPNALANETSPYLLQHAHNPVRWLPWGEQAFEEAKSRDVPILLSVGYSACHWCHVMERESFENEEIAALMNEHFVPVKVDREERPDVDSVYMTAVQMMTGQGGWPMTVFLTPDGQPFYGGTYFPPDDRYGRPGFRRVLLALHDAWTNRREELTGNAQELTAHLSRSDRLKPVADVDPNATARAVGTLEGSFDAQWGGFGSAPKFPNTANLAFLLAHHHRTGNARALEMLEVTLNRMAAGGMYDHLGGGFARYSTDERWLVPHFEKMLYDNAQLIQVYINSYLVTSKTEYFVTAKESLEYALREMRSPEGGFYSAQDADSEGVEGKFFVWQEAEIDAVLGEDSSLFKRAYGVTPGGNWEHSNVLWRVASDAQLAQAFGLEASEVHTRLENAKMRLFFERDSRVKPGLDDKILASWNGLMLSALALAGRAMGGRAPKYRAAAEGLASFLQTQLSFTDAHGRTRLHHTFKNGTARITGLLEDYSLVALGFLELYRTTFNRHHLEFARSLLNTILELFSDPASGFFDTPTDGEALIVRPKSYFDSAMPSGNGATAQLLIQLARLTGDAGLEETAVAVIKGMLEVMPLHPTGFGSLNAALEHHLAAPREIAIVGEPAREDTATLAASLERAYLPHTAVVVATPGDAYLPVLEERGLVDGKAAAYVCENLACQLPVTTPEALLEAMKSV